MEKDKELKESKPTNTRLKMTIGILCLAISSVVELYLMINDPDSYLFLGVVGLAILCFVYWVMDQSFKARREQESVFEKDMESLYKAQKVSYITVKQGLAKLEEILDDLGEELSFPLDEVLQAQKAVGRVTVQKSKENIDAIVESNEKLIESLQTFEQKFTEIGERIESLQAITSLPVPEQPQGGQDEVLAVLARVEAMLQEGTKNTSGPDRQQEILDSLAEIADTMRSEFSKKPVQDRQQEILDYLARIESSVKDEISELEVHMESKIDEIPSAVQEEQKMSPEDLELLLGETGALMDSINLDLPEMETPSKEATAPEEISQPEERPVSEPMPVTELPEQPDDKAVQEQTELPVEPEAEPEEESYEIPEHLKMPGMPDFSAAVSDREESQQEPEAEPEEESYEIPEHLKMPGMPDFSAAVSDGEEGQRETEGESEEESYEIPEHLKMPEVLDLPDMPATPGYAAESEVVMTPEEIAALLGESVELQAAEPLVEETPPMPDLSDPGHVMTPEEIAAVLANM